MSTELELPDRDIRSKRPPVLSFLLRRSTLRRVGRVVSLLALVSGTWFPATGFLHTIGQWIPSYWLVQAGRISLHGHGWGTQGWAVVLGWTVVLGVLAMQWADGRLA